MNKKMLAAAAFAAAAWSWSMPASASGGGASLPEVDWSFNGLFGTFDRAQLQRGTQVYKEVCHSCHGLQFIAFRNLTQLGFTADQVAQFASDFEVQDGPNDEGDMFMRPARPPIMSRRHSPTRRQARAANNGALPPDLSLIVDAREGGATICTRS